MTQKISNSMDCEWQAWVNMMPPAPSILHVAGCIDVGNETDSATIVFDSLQKSNPPNLVLRIVYQTIFVPREKGDTVVQLHYSQSAILGQFDKIIVVYPNETHVTIDTIRIAS